MGFLDYLDHPADKIRQSFYEDYTASILKTLIILWALVVIVLALSIQEKWVLAGILAWEILP
jgi:hypothetical protein